MSYLRSKWYRKNEKIVAAMYTEGVWSDLTPEALIGLSLIDRLVNRLMSMELSEDREGSLDI